MSFPKPDLYPLAWVGLAPLLISIRYPTTSARTAGFITGLIFFFGTQYWIYHSINHFGHVPFVISILVVIVLCAYEGIYTSLFATLVRFTHQKTQLPLNLATATLWVGGEYLRGIVFTGFPWSLLGYTQYKVLPLIQIADITAVYGLSFLIAYANALITDIIASWMNVNAFRRNLAMETLMFAVIMGCVLWYGTIKLKDIPKGNPVTISVIQGNLRQDMKWDERFRNYCFSRYEALSSQAAKNNPQLIVWPESALPFLFMSEEEYTNRLLEFHKTLNTHLLFGSDLVRGYKNNKTLALSNSAVLLSPTGKTLYTYDKIKLVPFGEYIPLKDVLGFIDKLVVSIGEFIKGNNRNVAKTPFGTFATLICYEIIFPNLVREFYRYGGDFIVTITNDAWFGQTSGPYQHFAMAVLRTVENRKPLIRAANTGISGFVDSSGRVQSKTELFETVALTDTINKDGSMTFYTAYGNVFVTLCNILNLLIVIKLIKKQSAQWRIKKNDRSTGIKGKNKATS
ncbi:MAG: apolipoprotein N-acyltransferase [Nitrospirae bacterium]|nr:apolipoprotein N-acyltransferase [Nitrospirota bacterium]